MPLLPPLRRLHAHSLPALFIVAVSLLAPPPVRAGDEVAFAEALAARGYDDLAEEVCARIERREGIDPSGRGTLDRVRAAILAGKIGRENDPSKRDLLRDEAIDRFRGMLRGNSGDTGAKFDLGDLLAARGKSLIAGMKRPGAAVAELRAKADALFTEAEQRYGELVRDGPDASGSDERRENLLRVRYRLPVMFFEHAALFEPGSSERRELLGSALRSIIDFRWDYGERIAARELMIYQARASAELGDWESARSAFAEARGAVSMASDPGVSEAAAGRLRDIARQAFYYEAVAGNAIPEWDPHAVEGYRAAVAAVEEMFRAFDPRKPPLIGTPMGQAALIEKARAWHHLGDIDRAVHAALELAALKPETCWTNEAKDLMSRWGGGVWTDDPALLSSMIAGSLSRGDDLGAIALCRRLLSSLAESAEAERAPAAWNALGRAFQSLKRYYEAALAFEAAYRRYPESPEAAESVYRAARCYSKMSAISGGVFDRERFLAALAILKDRYPDSPYAAKASLIVAESLEGEGAYLEAADAYAKIEGPAEVRETARSREGRCYYLQAERCWKESGRAPDESGRHSLRDEAVRLFSGAEKRLTSFLDSVRREPPADPEANARRKEQVYLSTYDLARLYLHEAVHREKEVGGLFRDVETTWAGDPERIGAALYLVEKADLAVGDLEAAEKIVRNFGSVCRESPRGVEALRDLAAGWDAVALAEPGTAKGRRAAEKSVRYFRLWLDESVTRRLPVGAGVAAGIAERMLALSGRPGLEVAEKRDLLLAVESLLERLLAGMFTGAVPPPTGGEEWHWSWKLCRVLAALEKFKEAAREYEKLCEARPDQGMPVLELSEVYFAMADRPETPADVREAHDRTMVEKIGSLLAGMRKSPDNEDVWWYCHYNHLRAMAGLGRYLEADEILHRLRISDPEFGGDGWRPKFEALEAIVAEQLSR